MPQRIRGAFPSASATLLFALLACFPFNSNRAQAAFEQTESLTQYTQDVWRTDSGLPQDWVLAIAQTPDGYLWLATEEGLARFDGERFSVFDKQNTRALRSNHISALLVDSRQNLWIGTQGGGLTKFKDGKFTTYTTRNGLADDTILSLYEDERGVLWIGTSVGGLSRLQNGRFEAYTSKDGLPSNAIFSIAGDRHGKLWIGTHSGLARLENGKIAVYTTQDGLGDNYIRCLHASGSGDLWIGTNQGGLSHLVHDRFTNYTTRDGLSNNTVWSVYEDRSGTLWVGTFYAGLSRFSRGHFTSYSVKDGLPARAVLAILEDREGNFWIGTGGGGLARLKSGSFTAIASRQGLSNDVILPVFEDHEGAIWAGTNGSGVNRIRDGRVTAFAESDGLAGDVVFSIAEDKKQNLWISTNRGLSRFDHGRFKLFGSPPGLPSNIVLCLYRDRKGTLWAGSRAGLGRFDGRRFVTYTMKNGLSSDYVSSLYADQSNTLWIGTGGGGLNKFDGRRFSSYMTHNGLSSNTILSITGDSGGVLWIGTSGGGLDRFKNGQFTSYTTREGLFEDELCQVLCDREGYIWISSNRGVFRVPKWQLNAYAEGRLSSIDWTVYGISDGLKSKECNGGFQPSGWQTKDGRLLFSTMKGIAIVNPEKLRPNRLPPPVSIESVGVDGLSFDPFERVQAKPGRGKMEFHFTALSLVSPEKIRFKYKLEPFDKEWIDAGQQRAAYYTNIPPGEYQFKVIASNNDGVWNKVGASLPVALLPHYYQTPIFMAICAMAAAGLCLTVYRLRISHLKLNEKRLHGLVKERTQALQEQVHAKQRAHAELAEAQQHLIELSRLSGMAEVATGVLHNVGNVLNSVNVGASVISSKIRDSRIDNLSAAIDMLQEHAHELSDFVERDPKGQRVLLYLSKLASHLQTERTQVLGELELLVDHIDHIKEIVATQQDYARVSALVDSVSLAKVIDDALRMVQASMDRHHVEIIREIEEVPNVAVARHQLLEILVNLLRNAKQAVLEHNQPLGQIRIRVRNHSGDRVRIEVQDTGIGLAPENLTRIFAHGFTTKSNGHGFGLHSGALAARQMKGSLWAESKGPGHGATFILDLPADRPVAVAEVSLA